MIKIKLILFQAGTRIVPLVKSSFIKKMNPIKPINNYGFQKWGINRLNNKDSQLL